MLKLSDLLRKFQTAQKEIPMDNRAVLGALGFAVKEKAQALIGTHQLFWAGLKPSTIETKRRKHQGKGGDPGSPLYATGDFERSIEYKLVGKNSVAIFSKARSAQYTEFGTSHMRPRPVFLPAAKLAIREMMGKNQISKFYLKELR